MEKPKKTNAMPEEPITIALGELGEPVYVGSVQRLYAVPGHPGLLACETTSGGSVFDVGTIFDVPGSDVGRAVFRHLLYSRMGPPEIWGRVAASVGNAEGVDPGFREMLLGSRTLADFLEKGAKTHHVGMPDGETGEVAVEGLPAHPNAFNVVRKFTVMKPPMGEVLGSPVYDYSGYGGKAGYVIPLEYIVRFGITSGSSVYRKYLGMGEVERVAYRRELGVTKPLEAWQLLERPIADFTSKYEPEDRNVTRQEAAMMSGLSVPQFARSAEMSLLGSWAVRTLLEEVGLLLWDIKWEFAWDGSDLVFVDTIDTDSFRATRFHEGEHGRTVIHFNKQAMRDYYRILCGDWFDGVNAAKGEAKERGVAFTEILKRGQEEGRFAETPVVEKEFMAIQIEKMEAIKAQMMGAAEAGEIEERLRACGEAELAFYDGRGALEAFLKFNRV